MLHRSLDKHVDKRTGSSVSNGNLALIMSNCALLQGAEENCQES